MCASELASNFNRMSQWHTAGNQDNNTTRTSLPNFQKFGWFKNKSNTQNLPARRNFPIIFSRPKIWLKLHWKQA
jgi:hypothetical protein